MRLLDCTKLGERYMSACNRRLRVLVEAQQELRQLEPTKRLYAKVRVTHVVEDEVIIQACENRRAKYSHMRSRQDTFKSLREELGSAV